MSYLLCLDDCGHEPDLTSPYPDSAINWIGDSTPDQRRIEDWLKSAVNHKSRLLHVGIGNSSLGMIFDNKVQWIRGVTLGKQELELAQELMTSNYHPMLENKYGARLLQRLFADYYDFIIDNNLASYACCVTHFHQMMDNYRNALAPGGAILTDRAGLAHAPGDPNWNLVDDIQAVADRFGLVLTRETEDVYALRK